MDRLDVHNGVLLSALWDAAFDKGLVSFDGGGKPLASRNVTKSALTALSLGTTTAERSARGAPAKPRQPS